MSEFNETAFWSQLEETLGINDLEAFVSTEIHPELGKVKSKAKSKDSTPWQILVPTLLGFFSFIILWNILKNFTPDNGIGIAIDFITFPIIFLASIAVWIYVFRNKIATVFAKSKDIFIVRSRILASIATRLNLEYAALPGGPSESLKTFAAWDRCPEIIKNLVALMEAHAGFECVSDTIRRSGLASDTVHVLGTQDTKDKYYAQEA